MKRTLITAVGCLIFLAALTLGVKLANNKPDGVNFYAESKHFSAKVENGQKVEFGNAYINSTDKLKLYLRQQAGYELVKDELSVILAEYNDEFFMRKGLVICSLGMRVYIVESVTVKYGTVNVNIKSDPGWGYAADWIGDGHRYFDFYFIEVDKKEVGFVTGVKINGDEYYYYFS